MIATLTALGVDVINAFNHRWRDMICTTCQRRQAIFYMGPDTDLRHCVYTKTCHGTLVTHDVWLYDMRIELDKDWKKNSGIRRDLATRWSKKP